MLENQQASRGRDTSLIDGDGEVLIAPKTAGVTQTMMPTPIGLQTPETSPARGPENLNLEPQLPPDTITQSKTAELDLPTSSQLPALPSTDDTDIGGPIKEAQGSPPQMADRPVHPLLADMKRPTVSRDCMRDPLNESFYLDIWHAIAENNTRLFRNVFRCMPDNEVKTWKEYKEYAAYSARFHEAQGGKPHRDSKPTQQDCAPPSSSGPPGQGISVSEKVRMAGPAGEKPAEGMDKLHHLTEKIAGVIPLRDDESAKPLGKVEEWAEEATRARAERHDLGIRTAQQGAVDEKHTTDPMTEAALRDFAPLKPSTTFDEASLQKPPSHSTTSGSAQPSGGTQKQQNASTRRRRATTRGSRREFHASDELLSRKDAEEMMNMVQGHLVVWPYDWLMKEEQGGNWLYTVDGLAPLEIYN